MNPVKIVFVGVGNMGQMAHLRNYTVLPDCQVVAIVEGREQLARTVARRYGIDNIFPSIEAFKSARIEFDAFVSAQPYQNQKNIMPELYAFGKPVLSEKPIALGIETGRELARLAREHQVTHVIGYHKRSDPAMEFGKALSDEWQANGRFGSLRYVRATMPAGDWVANGFDGLITSQESYPAVEMETDVTYYADSQFNREYNDFVNYYIHQINTLRLLLGEDYHITYAEKSRILLVAESISHKPAVIELSPWYNTLDWQETYLLAFAKGWIRIELPAPLTINQPGRVTVYEDNGEHPTPKQWSPTLPHIDAMKNQATNFIKLIRGEKAAQCTAEEAVKDLENAREFIDIISKLA